MRVNFVLSHNNEESIEVGHLYTITITISDTAYILQNVRQKYKGKQQFVSGPKETFRFKDNKVVLQLNEGEFDPIKKNTERNEWEIIPKNKLEVSDEPLNPLACITYVKDPCRPKYLLHNLYWCMGIDRYRLKWDK